MSDEANLHTDEAGDAKRVPVADEKATLNTSEAFPVAQGTDYPEAGAERMQQSLTGTKSDEQDED